MAYICVTVVLLTVKIKIERQKGVYLHPFCFIKNTYLDLAICKSNLKCVFLPPHLLMVEFFTKSNVFIYLDT